MVGIMSDRRINLINTMRKLWEQHIMWTRSFIISTASDLGDLQLVTNRLLRNPGDFADVLETYYGREKANKFKLLLEQHLQIAGNLVNYAKAGDTQHADEERKKWYRNADEIAMFLSGINPYWSRKEWQTLLYEHLKMTEDEAAERLNKNYAADITQYDLIETEALEMADLMSTGIIQQFKWRI